MQSMTYLRATRGACNPNVQVVITHASHLCSKHSFVLPLKMNGMHRRQFDHARFDHLPRKTYAKHSNGVRAFCRPHSLTFGYY